MASETEYETMSLTELTKWARQADAGEYLVEYENTGITDIEDPGSMCGYGADELDAVKAELAMRDLSLEADDRGLVVQANRAVVL